jgi:hypothetical protein
VTIVPVSNLRDYNKVLSKVSYGNEVTLVRNGKAEFAIIDIEELERIRAEIWLISELRKSEISISAGHTYSEEDIRREFNVNEA